MTRELSHSRIKSKLSVTLEVPHKHLGRGDCLLLAGSGNLAGIGLPSFPFSANFCPTFTGESLSEQP